jgi:hypothetical protein
MISETKNEFVAGQRQAKVGMTNKD